VHTRVKICGISTVEQARWVCDSGADALGLVFHAASPRAVEPATAREICAAIDPLLSVVALFVDAPEDAVREVLAQCPIDQLQFHGEESPEYCASFRRPYIKALRMRPGLDVSAAARDYAAARALLLDSYRPGVAGGTGETFDWGRVPELQRPWMLAGGLTPDNVAGAMTRLRPPAVDVSGGVESAPGQKDPALLRRFIAAVRATDERMHEDAA
jgi:phosphoribosylanthranilate isomerase